MNRIAYWTAHMGRHAPGLLLDCGRLAMQSALSRDASNVQVLIATHHKVLTVFLGRIFQVSCAVSGRQLSRGRGDQVDYTAEFLLDHHSEFDFQRLEQPYVGLHVRRDPRDLLVSAVFYHQTAAEAWLHVPRAEFNGKTYQQTIRSMDSMQDRLLFELDHSGGENIASMLSWEYGRESICELRYEELVDDSGLQRFASAIEKWPLPRTELKVLRGLFRYFSVGGPGAAGSAHLRDSRAGQWREHFTPAVKIKFDRLFPGGLERLGYE